MRHLASIQQIQEIQPIDNADKIEKARIKDWWVVVLKDEYTVGNFCVYYEIDSLLPIRPEYEFLLKGSKPKKMLHNGKEIEGIRLKTKKIRGCISQGLIMSLSILKTIGTLNTTVDPPILTIE